MVKEKKRKKMRWSLRKEEQNPEIKEKGKEYEDKGGKEEEKGAKISEKGELEKN